MEFTGAELAGGAELATPVEKAAAGWPSELRAGEIRPSHGELGGRSARRVWAGFVQATVSCMRASSTPATASWATSAWPR